MTEVARPSSGRSPASAQSRLARSYGPIAVAAALFLVMGLVVDPVTRPIDRSAETAVAAGLPGGAPAANTVAAAPGATSATIAGSIPGGTIVTGGAAAGPTKTTAKGPAAAGGVQRCTDRAKQVSGDPYAPPCVTFTGDNGGATSRGVTKDDIVVTIRQLEGPSAAQIFAQISGQQVNDSPEAQLNTVNAFAEYFSTRFNFYGRKLKMVFFKGQGSGSAELLGGGKEQALADSVIAAKEKGAFADLSGITIPYADALARQQVVNFGAPYPSAKWVLCACDPVMLALGLSPKANEQDYLPEWLSSGLAFVDQDIVSQLIDPKQWVRAFGIAFNAEPEPQGRSFPYAAYKKVRPNDEPVFGYEEIYYQFYLLAIGLQLAGPNLAPQTFQAGMFAYPGGTGPRGSWHFGPGDFTPTDDFRELWWDPNRTSPQNNKQGAWVQLNGGKRYFPGQVPHTAAPYFQAG